MRAFFTHGSKRQTFPSSQPDIEERMGARGNMKESTNTIVMENETVSTARRTAGLLIFMMALTSDFDVLPAGC